MNAAAAVLVARNRRTGGLLVARRVETRSIGSPVELRAGTLTGTAIRYGDIADIGDFTEEFRPGAFRNLGDPDVLFVAEHDPTRLLGRAGAGTLRLTDQADALRYEVSLPDTSEGNDTETLAERNDYAGVSIGFQIEPGGETWSRRNGRRHRTITAARLDHISPVSRPAYDTSIERKDDGV